MVPFNHKMLRVLGVLFLTATCVQAAPFAKTFKFTQPDGTRIDLWGQGDEFQAVFKHQGYPVVFDPVHKTYMYAKLSPDGTALIQTSIEVGKVDPKSQGLDPDADKKVSPEARRKKVAERFQRWNLGVQVTERWQQRKMMQLQAEQLLADGPVLAPPSSQTIGQKMGLCLLVDFDDDPSSVPQARIINFCNGDNYNGYGNNGSVKKYFRDVSNNMLTYSNVVTAYIRIPNTLHQKSYYNDTSKDCGSQANLMIKDALDIMKALPNYQTEILPTFNTLTVDGNNRVVACNVFYAGDNGGVWSMGLWPHSWALYEAGEQELLPGGKKVFRYQVTNIGSALELGTFCHENGHMLCGFPDLYDYDYDSVGGAGVFCLMDYGGGGGNPVQVCAYLKRASGWATTVEVNKYTMMFAELSAAVGAEGYNRFYRFAKPGTPTEYYLFENRQQSGRDAEIPAAGVAIWHIDELGNRDDQRLKYNTKHQNYECTLVQADNRWHFQHNVNAGDANDLYYFGNDAEVYSNAFTDVTAPSACWWDGSESFLEADCFSASGPVITFSLQMPRPVIVTPSPLPDGRIGTFYSCELVAGEGGTPYVWREVVSNSLPLGLTLSGSGVLSGLPEVAGTVVFDVAVTGINGKADTNQFSLTVWPAFNVPYVETFDRLAGALPDGWAQEYVTNQVPWTYVNGNGTGTGGGSPLAAYSGLYDACFKVGLSSLVGSKTRLVSPGIVFASASRYAQLSFWHFMAKKSGIFQDKLRVLYKTAYTNEWQPLATYDQSVEIWTRRTLSLPGSATTYYIAFEGMANYGYGLHIDDVEVVDAYVPLDIVASSVLPDAVLNQPYSFTLEAAGNEGPFTFALTAGSLPLPDGLSLSSNGVISGTATNLSNLGSNVFTVALTDGQTNTVSSQFTLNVGAPRVELFAEPFENNGVMPSGWTQAYVTNTLTWVCRDGGGNGDTFNWPTNAHEGLYNAVLFTQDYGNHVTRLVSPAINLGAAPANIRLDFWHCMTALSGQQDELRVYYKTSVSGAWNLLASYTNNVSAWMQRTVPLPTPTSTYYLAFEGNARFGQGVCIDDIRITDESLAPIIMTTSPLPAGTVGEAYSQIFTAVGGVEPYTWDLVSGALPSGLVFSADGVLSGTPEVKANVTLGVRVVGADGFASTNLFALKVSSVQRIPYTQNFEGRSQLPLGWTQEFVPLSTLNWRIYNGTSMSGNAPNKAHSGTNNALLVTLNSSGFKTRLITPVLDMGVGTTNAQLSFWFCMAKTSYQDELTVLYKTNATDTAWNQLTNFNKSVVAWSNIVLSLPNPTPNYMIAFEGLAKAGAGICIDDVGVTGDLVMTPYEQWKVDHFGLDAGNELIAGDEADPDNDGIVNWREYAMALDPLTPDTDGLPTGDVTSGYLTLTYRENQAATDVRFEVEACADLLLQNWTTNGVSEILRADSNLWWQVKYRHDVPVTNAPQRFLRLKLTWPTP